MSHVSKKAGCGGVLRDHRGSWLQGFTKELGLCSAREAEEWAIYEGLKLAHHQGFRHIVIESDAQELVKRLQSECKDPHTSLLCLEIIRLMKMEGDISIQYVKREHNCLVDSLTKEGISSTRTYR